MKRPRKIYWCRKCDEATHARILINENYWGNNCGWNRKDYCQLYNKPCKYYVYEVVKEETK